MIKQIIIYKIIRVILKIKNYKKINKKVKMKIFIIKFQ